MVYLVSFLPFNIQSSCLLLLAFNNLLLQVVLFVRSSILEIGLIQYREYAMVLIGITCWARERGRGKLENMMRPCYVTVNDTIEKLD